MSPFRHIALAGGSLAVATLALTGCSLTSNGSQPTSAPTTHAASTPAQADGTTPATAPTSASAPASTGASTAASTDASAGGSTAPTPATEAVTRYSDKTGLLQLPVSNAAIPQAPAGLRDFARVQLKQMWHDQFQNDPGCEGIAQLRIKRSTATAAYVEAGWGATTPTCPQYAGNPGWWEVWGNASGAWAVTLKGEGTASCSDLVAKSISRAVYPTCTDGSKKVPNPVG